ncbi:MAG: hypothetical protein K5895_04220 [Lachnospiraceae bacterium]|nr:hypothetical protein [Lachnospiraceae bacterium]
MLKLDGKFMRVTYAIFALSWCLGDISGNYHDDYKFGFWIISWFAAILPMIYCALGYKRIKHKWDNYTIKQVMFVVFVFACVSLFGMAVNGFHLFMWKDLFYISMPALYIFCIVNLDDSDDFDYYVDWIFYTFCFSFVQIAGLSSFTPANFSSISFADSYSPWESGLADAFLICFFYYYTRKKWKRCAVAIVLNVLSFKRLHLFYMVIYMVIERFLKNKPVPKGVEYLVKVLFIVSPLLVYAATEDSFATWFEASFGMDLNGFTMGRFNQINFINDLGENMTGLGMTHYMLVKYDFDIHRLHCDILRILIETTIVGLVVFVNGFVNIAKRNQKCFSLMVFFLIVMISSTCMENTYYWMLIYISIESIQRIAKREEEKENGAEQLQAGS